MRDYRNQRRWPKAKVSLQKKIRYFFLIIVLLCLAAFSGVFFLRQPVLIVTDAPFVQLYGDSRIKEKTVLASLKLFRRVIPVPVADSAGADLVTLAVEGVSPMPWAVLFPNRYSEAARVYCDKQPHVPVFLMGDGIPFSDRSRRQLPSNETFHFVSVDTIQNLYRAGLCAAFFAGEGSDVLFYYEGTLSGEYRDAFREGLMAQSFFKNPVYLNVSSDYTSYNNVGCVVLMGQATKFFERNLDIPIILFSWIDPVFTPRSVKVIFDDSPWALVPELIKGAPAEGGISVSSGVNVILDRMEEKKDFRKLQGLIKGNFEKK